MRIIHFTDTYYPTVNGVSFAVEQYAKNLASQGNEVVIYTTACSLHNKTETEGNLTIIRVRSIPFILYPGLQAALPNLVKMYTFIKEFNPDIIHIHSPLTLGILGTIFGQIFGIRIVNTYHTLFSDTTMYLSPKRFFPSQHDKLKPDHTEKRIIDQITWRLQIIFFNLSDLVLAPTKVIGKQLRHHGLKSKMIVLPSGLDTTQYSEKESYKKTFRILHLGRLGLEKSTDIVIKAFAKVIEKIPEVKLIIAGDGPAKASLIQLAKKLNIEKSVEFLGMVDHYKTPELYRSCDLFVSASTMETQGLVLLEAMLSGLPVVAAAVNAPVDIVKNGVNGYLFPENDAEKCADRIISLYEGANSFKKIGSSARQFALKFDSKDLTGELQKTYRNLAHRR